MPHSCISEGCTIIKLVRRYRSLVHILGDRSDWTQASTEYQCCGSRMFISRILICIHPGSRIQQQRVWQFNNKVETIRPFHRSPSSPSCRAVYPPPVWRRRVRASLTAPPYRSQPRHAHTPSPAPSLIYFLKLRTPYDKMVAWPYSSCPFLILIAFEHLHHQIGHWASTWGSNSTVCTYTV